MLTIWWSSVPFSLKPFLNLELILYQKWSQSLKFKDFDFCLPLTILLNETQWPVAKCIQFDSYIRGLPQMESQGKTPCCPQLQENDSLAIPAVYAEGPLSGVHLNRN